MSNQQSPFHDGNSIVFFTWCMTCPQAVCVEVLINDIIVEFLPCIVKLMLSNGFLEAPLMTGAIPYEHAIYMISETNLNARNAKLTSSAPKHYLNQRWRIVNLTLSSKLRWNINRKEYIVIQEYVFECVDCEMAAIWLCFNVLKFMTSISIFDMD